MNKNGIDSAMLSLAGPGFQIEENIAIAVQTQRARKMSVFSIDYPQIANHLSPASD